MMNLSDYTESQSQFFDSLKPLMASSDVASHILSDAAKDLLAIQSELAAASFAKVLTSLVPAFAPGDPSYALWQMPADYQAEMERWVHALMTSVGVLSRVQQQMVELQGQSFTHGVQDAAKAMAKVNGVLASRRVSAEVISFSDRRAASEAKSSAEAKPAVVEADRAASPRGKNQATG